MSIQQYFNSKKSNLVSFFNNINNLLTEISIAMQLQIDNQYVIAKNRMKNAASDTIHDYCKSMKSREPEIHNKVLFMICEFLTPMHNINSVRAYSQPPHKPEILRIQSQRKTGVKWDIKDEDGRTQEKVKVYNKPDQIIENNQQVLTGHITKSMSASKIKRESLDINPNTTASKSKNKGLQTISKNSRDLFNTQFNSQQIHRRTQPELKQQQPINLMNKKRNFSSNKNSQRQVYKSRTKDPQNYRQSEYPVNVPLTHSYSESKFKSNPVQYNEKTHNYQNFRSNHKTQQNHQQNPLQNSLSSSKFKYEQGQRQFQVNQNLCEKLDKKIHEQAVALLNKVKPKRSPNRKKTMNSLPKKTNYNDKSCNAFSVLDISNQNPINLTRQGYLQRLRQQK